MTLPSDGPPDPASKETRGWRPRHVLFALRSRLRLGSRWLSTLAALILFAGFVAVLYVYKTGDQPPFWDAAAPLGPPSSGDSALHIDNRPHSVLILQQIVAAHYNIFDVIGSWVPDRPALYKASESSHQRYAQTWGYEYRVSRRNWAAELGLSPHMNKLYAVMNTLEVELEKPNGAEWIMVTDADTLILDPIIAIEYLLPPRPGTKGYLPNGSIASKPLDPPPLILVNQDSNGLNAGVLLFRVDQQALDFLRQTLDLEPAFAAIAGDLTLHPENLEIIDGVTHPSDQYLFGWSIQRPEHAHVAAALYEIPMKWFNSYSYEHDEGSQAGDGVPWTPELQIHLVNNGWGFRHDWETWIAERAEKVYETALSSARETGTLVTADNEAEVLRQVFLASPLRDSSLYAARHWWAKGRSGIAGMKWPDF